MAQILSDKWWCQILNQINQVIFKGSKYFNVKVILFPNACFFFNIYLFLRERVGAAGEREGQRKRETEDPKEALC